MQGQTVDAGELEALHRREPVAGAPPHAAEAQRLVEAEEAAHPPRLPPVLAQQQEQPLHGQQLVDVVLRRVPGHGLAILPDAGVGLIEGGLPRLPPMGQRLAHAGGHPGLVLLFARCLLFGHFFIVKS